MSATHPSHKKIEALRRRWDGEERRLEAIAHDLRAGRDWTVHLRGLPFVSEVPPLPGEAYGRDLRGADLQRLLRPTVDIVAATARESAQVAAIGLEGLRNNTALPHVTPFPVEVEGAGEIALAMRRGDRFLLARCDGEAVGVIRLSERSQLKEHTDDRPYIEVSGLAVLPPWRRTGIGARLLKAAEKRAYENGYKWVLLRTALEVGLVPWYMRHGYEERTTRQLTYPDAPTFLDVIMSKRIVEAPQRHDTAETGRLQIIRAGGARQGFGGGSVNPLITYGGVACQR